MMPKHAMGLGDASRRWGLIPVVAGEKGVHLRRRGPERFRLQRPSSNAYAIWCP